MLHFVTLPKEMIITNMVITKIILPYASMAILLTFLSVFYTTYLITLMLTSFKFNAKCNEVGVYYAIFFGVIFELNLYQIMEFFFIIHNYDEKRTCRHTRVHYKEIKLCATFKLTRKWQGAMLRFPTSSPTISSTKDAMIRV